MKPQVYLHVVPQCLMPLIFVGMLIVRNANIIERVLSWSSIKASSKVRLNAQSAYHQFVYHHVTYMYMYNACDIAYNIICMYVYIVHVISMCINVHVHCIYMYNESTKCMYVCSSCTAYHDIIVTIISYTCTCT